MTFMLESSCARTPQAAQQAKPTRKIALAACFAIALMALVLGTMWAKPAQASTYRFPDVDSSHWVVTEGWLDYVVDNGIMQGYGDTGLFGPDNNLTRAEFAMMLWRAAGCPAAGDPGFSDVSSGDWFYEAVSWCKASGVVTGYGGTDLFKPNRAINRAELATMAYRFASYMGADMSADPTAFNGTADGALLDPQRGGTEYSYAYEYLIWTCDTGVLRGSIDQGQRWLDVDKGATRAQAAKVITVLLRDVIYQEGTYTVTFESNGGTAVEAQVVTSGNKATRVYPTRDGYTFQGWFVDPELTVEYSFASDVTSNMTLYAKWA